MTDNAMTSSRPYLLRAIYQWIVDNGFTPYLLVDATAEDVLVPQQYVNNGKIILNISPDAVQNLSLDGDEVSFSARFDGKPMSVQAPVVATLAIYARENGRGMVFTDDDETPAGPDDGGSDASSDAGKQKGKKSGQPALRIVK